MTRVPTLAKEMVMRLEGIQPAIADSFFPPANETDIRALEDTTGQSIPDDLLAFWRTYDGQDLDAFGIFDGEFLFLSVQASIDEWLLKKEVYETDEKWMQFESSPEVRPEVRNRGWIPFAWSPSGDTIWVDLSPTAAGNAGQVIRTRVAAYNRPLLSPSFTDWLEELVSDFRAGRITTDPECEDAILHDRRRT